MTSCVMKNDLWFQKWHKEFGEFLQQLKVILDKSSIYNVLAEGMYFFDNCSPFTFNFSDLPLLVWNYSNSSYDFWNQESVFVQILLHFVITLLKYKCKAKLKGTHLRESKGESKRGIYRENRRIAPPRHFEIRLSVYLFLKILVMAR